MGWGKLCIFLMSMMVAYIQLIPPVRITTKLEEKMVFEGSQYLRSQDTRKKGNKLKGLLNLALLISFRTLSDSTQRAQKPSRNQ